MDIHDLSLFHGMLCSLSPISERGESLVTESSSDVPLDQGWVVRPQLFFSCRLRPRGARLPRRANYTYCPDDIQVNQWLWQFGRGKPRRGGLSVAETEERRITVAKDGAKRAVATRARRPAELSRRQGPRADWNRLSRAIEYP